MRHKFELIPGSACNFRCSYCYEQAREDSYGGERMSEELVKASRRFAASFLAEHPADDLAVCLFGGEPGCYVSRVDSVLRHFHDLPVAFHVITNGTLILKHREFLREWHALCGDRLRIMLSYDWTLQNTQRCPGTEDSGLEAMARLEEDDLPFSVNTIFTRESLPELLTVFRAYLDFMRHFRPSKRVMFRFGMDNFNPGNTRLDWDACRSMATDMRCFLEKFPAASSRIQYKYGRSDIGMSCRAHNCGFGWRVLGCVDTDGSFYGCQGAAYDPRADMFRLGHISEGYAALRASSRTFMAKLPPACPPACMDCGALCKQCPLDTVGNDPRDFGGMPDEEHCRIHKLITWALEGRHGMFDAD